MFFGEFDYKVDEKGRVLIPPKFRRELGGEEIVLTPGIERCITVYSLSRWKKISSGLVSDQLTQSKLRKLNRAMFASAFSIRLDGQGRIILPITLRDYASIGEDVVIAGANTYFELWNKADWEEEKANSQAEAWHIIESLERR